jgi:hypothetical protein
VPPNQKLKRKNPLLWIFEPLEDQPRLIRKKLFSFDAVYLDGLLYLAVAQGKEPWNGLLVCTSHEHHAAITAQFPQLTSHPVLGKWLYLSQLHPDFESIAPEVVEMTAKRDPRLGVEPRPKRKA